MNKERHIGRAILGFLLSLMMIITVFSSGLLLSLKLSVFKGSDINEFLDEMGFHSTIQEVVVNEIKNQIPSGNEQIANLSDEALEAIFTEEVVKDVTVSITDAITEDKEIDLNVIKDDCINAITEVSETAIDEVITELKNTTSVIDIEALTNNSVIQKYQKDYNVDVTSVIIDQMETVYGSTSISLEEIDFEEVKSEAKVAIKEHVIPVIEEKVDSVIEEANVKVNEEFKTIKEENDLKMYTDAFGMILNLITIAVIVGISVSVVIGLVQVFLVYRKQKTKGIKNICVVSAITVCLTCGVSVALGIVKNIVTETLGDEPIEKMVSKFLNTNVSNASSTLNLVAISLAVMCVGLIILLVVMNKKKNTYNDPMNIA